jgi:hypothetical protein
MKLPDEVILELLHVITDEELIRFGVRLRKRDGLVLRKQARKHLQELLLAERTRREGDEQTEASRLDKTTKEHKNKQETT